MAIDGRLLGGSPGVPPTPAGALGAAAPLAGVGDRAAADSGGADATAGADHREVGISTQMGGPNNPASKKLDFEAAASDDLRTVLPGARVTGLWNPLQVADLKAALTLVPQRLLPRLHGTEFQLQDTPPREPLERLVTSTMVPKVVSLRPEAFDLPALGGTPGLHVALMAEFGRLMNDKPQQVLEFGLISGWKQTVFDRLGNVLKPAEAATGFAPGEPLPGTAPLRAPQPGVAGRGTQRLVMPEPSRLPPASRGTGRLGGGAPAQPEPMGGPVIPRSQERTDGGSRVHYSNETYVEYAFQPDARFTPGSGAKTDPRSDFAEALRRFALEPDALLATAPEKFLYLNADARQYPAAAARQMADAAGIDLRQVLATMVLTGRVTADVLGRIAEAHGLTPEPGRAPATGGAGLERLVERLTLDISLHGTATTRLLGQGQRLSESYHHLSARLPGLTAAFPGVQGIVSWLVGRAARPVVEARLARLDRGLAEARSQFLRLPLVVQLRVDPRLALGAAWFALPAAERAELGRPERVQQLIALAAGKAEDRAYIPQLLTPTERRVLASRTIVDALFDVSSQGSRFRSRFAGLPLVEGSFKRLEHSPEAALKALTARNGESVWALLGDDDRRFFTDRRTPAMLKQVLGDAELSQALAVLREGTAGAEPLRAALLRFGLEAVPAAAGMKAVLEGVVERVKATREDVSGTAAAPPLELALGEVRSQVMEGNIHFVQRLLAADGPDRLSAVLGPWVWGALSPAERKLFEDPDQRRVMVEQAQGAGAARGSLAAEAREFQAESAALQRVIGEMLQPDATFRREFERDPVGALLRHGVWEALPGTARAALTDGAPPAGLQALVDAIQHALAPVLSPSPEHARRLGHLKQAVAAVNAGNYRGLLALLRQPEAEIHRQVTSGIGAALEGPPPHRPGGPLTFV